MLAYLDTNIWIYAFENASSLGSSARSVVRRLRRHNFRIGTSLFVLNELLVLPTRSGDSSAVEQYISLFHSDAVDVLPYPADATRRYSHLRAFAGVKALDALHLATAAEAGVELFVTEDLKLLPLSVPGIGQIVSLSHLVF